MSAAKDRVTVILVHGVGRASPGNMKSALVKAVPKVADDYNVIEFVWNKLVDKPSTVDTVDAKYLSLISSAWFAAATINYSSDEQWKRRLLRTMDFTATLAPLLLPIWLLHKALTLILPSVSLAFPFWPLIAGTAFGLQIVCGFFLLCMSGRQTMLERVRAVVMTLVWPWIVLARSIFAGLMAIAFVLAIIGANAFWAGGSVARERADDKIPTYYLSPLRFSYKGLAITAICIILAIALVKVTTSAIERIAAPSLKIAGDVIRYLGDAAYREQIVDGLSSLVRSQSASVSVIAAHSLGSVIASDCLRAMVGKESPENPPLAVRFVTAGSPLRRFFLKAFPSVFVEPDELYGLLSAGFRGFRWVNIFRPRDWVGTKLGVRSDSAILDINTLQVSGGHRNYFGDRLVIERTIAALISEQKRLPTVQTSVGRHVGGVQPLGLTRLTRLSRSLFWLPFLIGYGWLASCELRYDRIENEREIAHRLFTRYTVAEQEICLVRTRETIGVPDHPRDIERLEFNVGHRFRASKLSVADRYVDRRRLQSDILAYQSAHGGEPCIMLPSKIDENGLQIAPVDYEIVPSFEGFDVKQFVLTSILFCAYWFIVMGSGLTKITKGMTGIPDEQIPFKRVLNS